MANELFRFFVITVVGLYYADICFNGRKLHRSDAFLMSSPADGMHIAQSDQRLLEPMFGCNVTLIVYDGHNIVHQLVRWDSQQKNNNSVSLSRRTSLVVFDGRRHRSEAVALPGYLASRTSLTDINCPASYI